MVVYAYGGKDSQYVHIGLKLTVPMAADVLGCPICRTCRTRRGWVDEDLRNWTASLCVRLIRLTSLTARSTSPLCTVHHTHNSLRLFGGRVSPNINST